MAIVYILKVIPCMIITTKHNIPIKNNQSFSLSCLLTTLIWLDIDECNNQATNDCHEQATCNNTIGSYTCTCNPGYNGDGNECEGKCLINMIITFHNDELHIDELCIFQHWSFSQPCSVFTLILCTTLWCS